MLNISKAENANPHGPERFKSFEKLGLSSANRLFRNFLLITLAIFIFMSFLPWTQNIQATGKVTTLQPDQRPQRVQSMIDGRVEDWYVLEGQRVKKGDTLVHISEMVTEYFDPQLIERTELQLSAKSEGINAYEDKLAALQGKLRNLEAEWALKRREMDNRLRQNEQRIQSKLAEMDARALDLEIAREQLEREQKMFDKGISSRLDLESRRRAEQGANASWVQVGNELEVLRREQSNLELSAANVANDYGAQIATVRSSLATTRTQRFDAEAELNQLASRLENNRRRREFHYILAPQSGTVAQMLMAGIGETVKAGQDILTIIPEQTQFAVELFIDPVDIPLLSVGKEGRFIFDGWPAFIFSGWPGQSFGTFAGRVVAIDNTVNEAGKYRILIAENREEQPWPEALRMGSGARGILLLNTVPVWYEIWRRLNGFPPDFYQEASFKIQSQFKSPIKSIAK